MTLGPTVENFLCELVPLHLSNKSHGHPFQLTTELTDLADGTYELKYSLPVEGTFELSIKLFGHHISASPFKVISRYFDTPKINGYAPCVKTTKKKSHFYVHSKVFVCIFKCALYCYKMRIFFSDFQTL